MRSVSFPFCRQRDAARTRADELRLSLADLEASIDGKRNQVAVVRATDFAPAKEAFDREYTRAAGIFERLNPENLARHVAEGAREADRASERALASLEDASASIEQFAVEYLKQRRAFHVRDQALRELTAEAKQPAVAAAVKAGAPQRAPVPGAKPPYWLPERNGGVR